VRIDGKAGSDKLVGSAASEILTGRNGDDDLSGQGGSDVLVGGNGVDTMAGGGGGDTFVFGHVAAARSGDVITDFSRSQGDVIDLGGIDADWTSSGNQSFTFIGSKGFSGNAGDLQYRNGEIAADVDGDGQADFHIEIANGHGLVADDFIL
jgi:Ca2+-binding RTX toxin-like protein